MGSMDNLGIFSDAQAITAAAASTNYIDLGVTTPQIGVGKNAPCLCIKTNTAPTDAGDTLSIEIQNDGDSAFGSAVTIAMVLVGAAGAEVTATDARLATAGAWIYRGQLPYNIAERYLRLYYNNTTSNGTFTIDAWLEAAPPSDHDKQVVNSPVGMPAVA